MSNPSSSNTSPLALQHHHHHHHPHHQRTVPAPTPPPPPPPPTSPSSSIREYRKGNWTLQETLILITAKRLDDERRYPGSSGGVSGGGNGGSGGGRPAEQRWKWIENYCWKNGCHRSQNQCNDKWDNLLREYKKVRDYESRSVAAISAPGEDQKAAGTSTDNPSYWTMERLERKERNLPTNLAREVFDALTDVLGRRAARRALPLALLPPPPTTPGTIVAAATVSVSPSVSASPSPSPQPMQNTPSMVLPLPAVTAQPPPPIASVSQSQPSFSDVAAEVSISSESTDNEDGNEPAPKRRKLSRLGSSVVRSATVITRTLLSCEEKRERRHRELLDLEERRLRLEEQRAEQHHQGFLSLVSAVNNLSGAIHALVSDHRNPETTGFRSPQVPHR
ncbi:hypothetical protein LUZ63_011248 [Rhynchospora breviuscula]|uniref:Myb-like domain-containing protein n=1 Tax=Rhynchospora breviuscula TaxID=2022672 RepID=A0A9Q0CIT8_9POAL|nr:hypothetical protein LUZ63_011248 [Rhynchospora breviuscula]